MTYICSIAPENLARMPIHNLYETQIQFNWISSSVTVDNTFHSRINDEWLLTFRNENTVVTANSSSLKFREWIPLLGNQIVVARAVFLGTIKAENIYCIRLYLNEQQLLSGHNSVSNVGVAHTGSHSVAHSVVHSVASSGSQTGSQIVVQDFSSVRLLQHESILYKVLQRCLVFCEPLEKMAKKIRSHHTLCDMDRHVLPLTNGYGLNMHTYCIDPLKTNMNIQTKYFHPIIIAHEVANRNNLALQLALQDTAKGFKILIITNKESVSLWQEKCVNQSIMGKYVGSNGIDKETMELFNIFILTEEELRGYFVEYQNIIESFESMMGTVMGLRPTETQIKRYMKNRFIQQFAANLPPFLIDWSTVIYDNIVPSAWREQLTSKNIVQTIIRNEIFSEWPSFTMISNSYGITQKEAQIMMPVWSRNIHYVELPRYILRKIKIRCEHIRTTVAEVRLQALESKIHPTFMKRNRDHLLQRLSLLAYSPSLFLKCLEHMAALPSVHDVLEKRLIVANLDHLLTEYSKAPGTCGVCFDPCGKQKEVTICGHTFCNTCSVELFGEAIRDMSKYTSCPYCRTPLHAADIFTIQQDGATEFPKLPKIQAYEKVSKTVSCVIDTLGHIQPPTKTTEVCPANIEKIHILIASLQKDQINEISNWLIQLASRPRSSVKVTLLAGSSDTWAEKLMTLLK